MHRVLAWFKPTTSPSPTSLEWLGPIWQHAVATPLATLELSLALSQPNAQTPHLQSALVAARQLKNLCCWQQGTPPPSCFLKDELLKTIQIAKLYVPQLHVTMTTPPRYSCAVSGQAWLLQEAFLACLEYIAHTTTAVAVVCQCQPPRCRVVFCFAITSKRWWQLAGADRRRLQVATTIVEQYFHGQLQLSSAASGAQVLELTFKHP